MNCDVKKITKMSRIYALIVIISNIVAIIVPTAISNPFWHSENLTKWENFIDDTYGSTLALICAFLVPTLVCIIYSFRLIKNPDNLMKKVVEIPSVYSLSSVIGWNIYYFVEIPFALYAKFVLGIQIKVILISSWAFSLISGMTAWTISYLGIELLNRTFLLPKLFPQGHIEYTKHSVHPKFSHLLLFCFMVTSIFPIAILMTGNIFTQINNNLPIQSNLIIIGSLFVIFSVIITFSLCKIIINPLGSLTKAAQNIKEGNYKSRVNIVTADELGNLADSFNDMAVALEEKEMMYDTFGKIVDPEVRDYLMKETHKIKRGGEVREVTVLFCDIRNFTAMSEKMSASSVVSLLNRYFTGLGKCITNHNGIVNKYIGDAIMAIFGAPVESKNSSYDAYLAACDMMDALQKINTDFRKDGLPELNFGIGIHTGEVFAGIIGAENRMEYTVIGDTVNTASRIESLCKTYKVPLLMSQSSVTNIQQSSEKLNKEIRFVDDAQIRGKAEPMKVYTC